MSELSSISRLSIDAPAPDVDGDVGDELDRLEADIHRKRRRAAASLGELRRRVDRATSWRQWVRARPLLWVAGGISFGFILGMREVGRRRR